MQTCQRGGKPLIVFGEPAEADGPSEGTLNHPRLGKRTNPFLASSSLTTIRRMPRLAACSAGSSPV